MIKLSEETKNSLVNATTNAEAIDILKTAGIEIDETNAETILREVKEFMNAEGRELSLDELETVGGGLDHIERNWANDGCQATVEAGSRCWSSDGCSRWEVCYTNPPTTLTCPSCGSFLYDTGETTGGRESMALYRCPRCGHEDWIQ